ncbi:uncharacterized protein LOC118801596 [Colossoma macropomum]|uniref:uncharacterized protein LOC118801596 n=1 Tax=Colossoma macropomum TaxID=42526 RepID=UPI0018652749|nr:uncharacterized protein LOC118801596 [Colossoma macropomum]
MNVNINYHFTRVIVLILTTELPTVLTAALPTKPSTATKCNALRKGIRPALYCSVTANGNSKGAPCIFPFFYNGAFYNDCVIFHHPNPWCSTTDNYTRDGKWGECLDYDVCQRHNNLSDPWRNIGFNLSSYPNLQMKDLNLQEGWYRFKGFSGDRMAYYCIRDTVSVQNLDCGAGLILYYLVPIRGVYRTCHSSCSKSSCGLNNYCNSSDGSCRCDCGFGIQTKKGFSTCTAVPEGLCVILVIRYDLLDMRNTVLLHAEVNKKDGVKTNSAINNTQLNNPVNIIVTHATAVAVNSSRFCLTWEKIVNGSCRVIPIDSNRTMCSCDDSEIFDDINQGFTGERLDMLIVVATANGAVVPELDPTDLCSLWKTTKRNQHSSGQPVHKPAVGPPPLSVQRGAPEVHTC